MRCKLFGSVAIVAIVTSAPAVANAPNMPAQPQPGQKSPPPLPEVAPPDYPRDASLGAIREWLKAKQLELAKARTSKGGDVVAVHVMAMLLPAAEWFRLADRTASDLGSKDVATLVDALKMAHELEQTSFQFPSLRDPLGNKVFPAAAARLVDMPPEVAKQLPGVLSRISRYADPKVSIPVFVELSGATDDAVRRQGVQGFMGLVVETEVPMTLSEGQRTEIADALVARFDDPDQRIRTMAISLLGQTKPQSQIYLPKLIELLKREETRFAALQAIGYYGPSASAALPALIDLLKAGDNRTLQQTCYALRGFGAAAAEAVPELVKLLETGNPSIRTAVASALGAIGPAASPALPKLDALVAENAQGAGSLKNAADSIRGNPPPN